VDHAVKTLIDLSLGKPALSALLIAGPPYPVLHRLKEILTPLERPDPLLEPDTVHLRPPRRVSRRQPLRVYFICQALDRFHYGAVVVVEVVVEVVELVLVDVDVLVLVEVELLVLVVVEVVEDVELLLELVEVLDVVELLLVVVE
jgi:hypothetical protein